MAVLVRDGQAHLCLLARAAGTLLHSGVDDAINVDALLPAWRALSPRCHTRAGEDVVDVATLVDVLRRRALWSGVTDTVGRIAVQATSRDPRGGSLVIAAAHALADALVVRLEAQKIAHGFPSPPAAVRNAFADPETARSVLTFVRDLAGVVVVPPEPCASNTLVSAWAKLNVGRDERPVHVVMGPHVRRVFDLLSPYVRRLRVDLALLGRAAGGVVEDDDVYRGLARLCRAEPATIVERRRADADEGFLDDDAGFIIDAGRLVEDLVDRRVRAHVSSLKRARAVVIGVVDERLLPFLEMTPTSVRVVVSGTSANSDRLVDAGSGAVLPVLGKEGGVASLSLPWRGFAPAQEAGPIDEAGWVSMQAAWRKTLAEKPWPAPVLHIGGTQGGPDPHYGDGDGDDGDDDDDSSRLALAAFASWNAPVGLRMR
jgi:hypothetical protein